MWSTKVLVGVQVVVRDRRVLQKGEIARHHWRIRHLLHHVTQRAEGVPDEDIVVRVPRLASVTYEDFSGT